MDNVRHLGDIESARGEVGRDEDADGIATEAGESLLAHILFQSAVIERALDAMVREVMGNTLGTLAVVAEDNDLSIVVEAA